MVPIFRASSCPPDCQPSPPAFWICSSGYGRPAAIPGSASFGRRNYGSSAPKGGKFGVGHVAEPFPQYPLRRPLALSSMEMSRKRNGDAVRIIGISIGHGSG